MDVTKIESVFFSLNSYFQKLEKHRKTFCNKHVLIFWKIYWVLSGQYAKHPKEVVTDEDDAQLILSRYPTL